MSTIADVRRQKVKGVRKVRKFLYASCLKILLLFITIVLSLCGDEIVLQYYVVFMQPIVRVFLFFFFQRNLTEYYNAVDAHNMMIIFASMLYERRIIFTSKKLYRLSACVQSANSVIYPMNWQHIFIPVLPMALMDYLLAPMPYLIGVPEVVYQVLLTYEFFNLF